MASTSNKQLPASGAPPVVKPVVQRSAKNSILVNRRQEQNPLLEHLRNVAWEYAAISPDFQVGATTCALFLSLRYYRLHPEYLHRRISDLGSAYTLRLLLFMIDAKDPENEIKELTKICLINNITIMAVWTLEETAHYLMTYKSYEHKSPDMIKERIEKNYSAILRSALTSIKGVNKTDVTTMRTNFGDFATMSRATYEELNLLPGFGKVKARRVKDAFELPFRNGPKGTIGVQALKGKGKSKEFTQLTLDEPEAPRPPGSPDWDIDLDLNSDLEDNPTNSNADRDQLSRTSKTTTHPSDKQKSPQPPGSPDWDIELDLNSDIEETDVAPQKTSNPPQARRLRPNSSDDN